MIFSFGGSLLILIFITLVTLLKIGQIRKLSYRIETLRRPTTEASQGMETGIHKSLAGLRGWLLLKTDEFKKDRQEGWKQIDATLAVMEMVSVHWTNPKNKVRLGAMIPLIESFRRYQQEIEDISTTNVKKADAMLKNNAAPVANEILGFLEEMVANQKSLIADDIVALDGSINELYLFLIIFSVFAVFFMTLVGFLLVQGVVFPLQKAVSAAQLIGKMDLETPISIKGSTEIEAFGLSLENMRSELRDHNRKLTLLNEELAQFSYRTSHDLKAPLITVQGLSSAIIEDIEDKDYESAKTYCLKINKQVKKLEDLVTDILDLAKADLEKDPKREEVNLNNLVDEIENKLEILHSNNNVQIKNKVDPSHTLFLSKVRILQLLENLISNSIKYCNPERSNKYVIISSEDAGDSMHIFVKDNGVGIPKEYHGRVFDMFQRFHPELASGSGLGMHITRKHIESMNGRISFESSKEDGTTFKIEIPKST